MNVVFYFILSLSSLKILFFSNATATRTNEFFTHFFVDVC
jgi:hypothetical protein